MPYRREGNKIYSKASGKWKLKQTCTSIKNAIKALGLLQGLEHGSIKKSEVGKKKYKFGKKRKVLYRS